MNNKIRVSKMTSFVYAARLKICVLRFVNYQWALVISELRTTEPVKRDLLARTFAANCR